MDKLLASPTNAEQLFYFLLQTSTHLDPFYIIPTPSEKKKKTIEAKTPQNEVVIADIKMRELSQGLHESSTRLDLRSLLQRSPQQAYPAGCVYVEHRFLCNPKIHPVELFKELSAIGMIQTFEHRWTLLFGFTPGHNVALPYYGFSETQRAIPQKRRFVIDPSVLSKGSSNVMKISTSKSVVFIPIQSRTPATTPSEEKKTFPFQQRLPNANLMIGFSSPPANGYVFTSDDDSEALQVHCTSPSKVPDGLGMLYTIQLTMQQYASLDQGKEKPSTGRCEVQCPTLVSTCLWTDGSYPLVLDVCSVSESISVELCDGRSKLSIVSS
jgi:hypothetical protein